MHSPPPPIQRKKSPVAMLMAILAIGLLIVVGTCALGGYWVYKTAKEPPQARKGFGRPKTMATLGNGWFTYRFDEVPMSIDLPSYPEKDTVQWETGSAILTKEWIYYTSESEVALYEIVGQWYRTREWVDLDDEVDYAKDWVQASYGATDLTASSRDVVFGTNRGKEVTGEFSLKGVKSRFRCFIVSDGKLVLNIYSHVADDFSKESDNEYDRIVNSISLR